MSYPFLDPLQFAFGANRSVDDIINMALHFILWHLDSPKSYARILFMDVSSVCNTIILGLLQDKLLQLKVPDSTCRGITASCLTRSSMLGQNVLDPRPSTLDPSKAVLLLHCTPTPAPPIINLSNS